MEILSHKNHHELLGYLSRIKSSLKEWQLVDIRLVASPGTDLTIHDVGEMVHALFRDREGKLYICNDREILMLVHCGSNTDPFTISKKVESALPPGLCEIYVQEPTPGNLSRLELLIRAGKPAKAQSPAEMREARRENVILVADDDMYMRALVKKGLDSRYTVHEAVDGNEVVPVYRKCLPDIIFLDIHMPGINGTDNLRELLAVDPQAFVVMLSADSSLENVESTIKQGARGFLTKPFTRGKLLEYIEKCPTIS